MLGSYYHVGLRESEQMFTYLELIEKAPLNLTAWKGDALWSRGVFDALDLNPCLESEVHGPGLDIGSGGGFPGMVLAIAHPERAWFLMESRVRRQEFLVSVKDRLGLSNISVVHARAERWIRENPERRESFEVVTMRAVAPFRVSLELGLPYVRLGGTLVLATGMSTEDLGYEANFVKELGGRIRDGVRHGDGRRTAVIEKCSATPAKFPRLAKRLGL